MYVRNLNEAPGKAVRWLFAVLGVCGGAILLFLVLRVVFGLWLYATVSNWVTTRLGFDHYVAELLTAIITTVAALLLPSVAAFVLIGRQRAWGMGAIIGSVAVVCLLVYTVGRDVCFDRQTGRPLCYYADTPSGRVFSYTSGFDPRTGTEFKLFTREVAEAEGIERRRQAEQERQQQERNRQRQAADATRQQLEQQKQEERQRADEARERQRREAEITKQTKQERAQQQRREEVARLEAERDERAQELERRREQERARQAEERAQQLREEEARLAQELEARRRNDEYTKRQENERHLREEEARREERREQQQREEESNRQGEARRSRKQERDRIIWGTINKAIERIPQRRF